MNTKRLLVLMCAAALCACSDRTAPAPTGPAAKAPTVPSLVELTGTVILSGLELSPVYLRTQDEWFALDGSEAIPMANVIGARVLVRGAWDADAGVVVESFLVLAVKGLPAIDGIVESTLDGDALRLVDGTYHMLPDAPADLINHLGARV